MCGATKAAIVFVSLVVCIREAIMHKFLTPKSSSTPCSTAVSVKAPVYSATQKERLLQSHSMVDEAWAPKPV